MTSVKSLSMPPELELGNIVYSKEIFFQLIFSSICVFSLQTDIVLISS